LEAQRVREKGYGIVVVSDQKRYLGNGLSHVGCARISARAGLRCDNEHLQRVYTVAPPAQPSGALVFGF
jgi:hypothetical protein